MEALILVVVSANSEIATTKALRFAKQADPEGKRTIGVITKVDMVAKCTEQTIVKMVSEPAKYRIHKGFFLVKLRSQEDLVNEMTLEEAIENETRYFREQVQYRTLPAANVGTRSLSDKLTWELVERIKFVLPSMKEEIQKKMKETELELQSMGQGIPQDSDEQRKFISQKLLDFTKKMMRICDGLYSEEDETAMRLLLLTRPAMEEFADAVNELMPGDLFNFHPKK